ncbi:PREDICTED: potassium/sodium hyperpolarization-activated cyclic nucleotide-gated channel 1-like [Ceratosolen solmsi marchali]|uniref:Potassium/sodium hyperpolarization-activated cyclic nucleotide-gated channel 1-like n=1 Tax=Ceratosolen solmsi marchali TaxID=326594 RepID=A0AAJ6YEF0_9HYME|nr:PREDICTED: potassium/sodium hyperpolarization-activated cyclic nucleotide-gated channel 1-like [Ceratosolen solmsi marchali]
MFIRNTHHCELIKTSDLAESSNKYCYSTFSNLFWSWTTINENHPKCRQYLISLATINKERKRHFSNNHWWIIHPFSKIRFFWNNIMMVVFFTAFFVIPFSLCFIILEYRTVKLSNINPFIYIICWIDIISNCITGFFDKQKREVILNQGTILVNYLKGYLLIDILTSLPYNYLTYPWKKIAETDDEYIITTLINFIPVLKLSRYLTFRSFIKQTFLYFNCEDISCQMFLTSLFCLYILHWFTCFCNYTLLVNVFTEKASTNESYIKSIEIEEIIERYQCALFIVLENFTATGYGSIEPQSEADIVVCTSLMILGRLVESYIIIILLQTVADRQFAKSKYEQIVNQLLAYAREKQLPAYMKKRLSAYYSYYFRNSYFQEHKILSSLSDALRKEVVLHSCRRLVENVKIFQNLPNSVLIQIVINLKSELYLENDVIIKAGIQGDCMYFLSSGTVIVLTPTGKEVCCLKDGAYFGEVALLVQNQRRVATVIALDICEVYRLDRKDFRKCIAVHSDLFAKIERLATERMQQTGMIEEENKQIILHSSLLNNPQRTEDAE